MITLDINQNLTHYIPSTVIGLIGLLFAYLYYYFKNRDDKKIEAIKSIKHSDRLNALEANLNELGVHIDTSTLNSEQKYNLLVKSLSSKTRKYLIISITAIVLSVILSLLIWSSVTTQKDNIKINTKDTSNIENQDDSTHRILNSDTTYIAGKVVDKYGSGLPNVTLSIIGIDNLFITDKNGNFKIKFNSSSASARLYADKKDYIPWNNYVSLPNENLVITMTKEIK